MRITCLIIEDEPLALERTKTYIERLSFLNLLGSFGKALEAMAFLKNQTLNLLFLDINLGSFSGIQLLETIQIQSRVILTTAYPDYALKGYELKMADYLLKPFSFEQFIKTVGHVNDLSNRPLRTHPERISIADKPNLPRFQMPIPMLKSLFL
jgi:DNA-binding LytR/AlgR family response regulator